MLIPLLSALAGAADPADADVVWARPFTVAEPYVWTMRGDHPLVTSGWIVQLRVEPIRMRPTQLRQPLLFVDDRPVRPVNFDDVNGCLVAVVSSDTPLDQATLFWSAPSLPERLSAADGETERTQARALGLGGLDRVRWSAAVANGGGAIAAQDEAGVMAIAQARAATCSSQP